MVSVSRSLWGFGSSYCRLRLPRRKQRHHFSIFAGLGITQTDCLSSVTLVFGVFTGSVCWWLVLVSGVEYWRNRLTPRRLDRFNQVLTKIFGILIVGFGLAAWVV